MSDQLGLDRHIVAAHHETESSGLAHLGWAVAELACAAHRLIAFGQHCRAPVAAVGTYPAADSLAVAEDTVRLGTEAGMDRGCRVEVEVDHMRRRVACWVADSDRATQCALGRTPGFAQIPE